MIRRAAAFRGSTPFFALALAFVAACQDAPAPGAGTQPQEPEAVPAEAAAPAEAGDPHAGHGAEAPGAPSLPLKQIMQGLEADMAALLHALWMEDVPGVAAAAGRIADHPRVPAEQMAAIQAALGAEFGGFAGHDQAVHGAAVALAEAAAGGAPPADLLPGVATVQAGCVACHTSFRARVAAALAGGR